VGDGGYEGGVGGVGACVIFFYHVIVLVLFGFEIMERVYLISFFSSIYKCD
jgi:hypothetical protein